MFFHLIKVKLSCRIVLHINRHDITCSKGAENKVITKFKLYQVKAKYCPSALLFPTFLIKCS